MEYVTSTEHFISENISTDITTDNGLRRMFYTKADEYAVGTLFVFMAVLGVVLNILAIIIIKIGKHSSKEIRIQLINLAIVDALSALFFPATSMVTVLMISFPESTALCKITRFIGYGALYTSPLWNVAISLERFTAVFFPLRMRKYSKGQKLVVAGVVWICGFLPQIEALLYAKIETRNGKIKCLTNSSLYRHSPRVLEWLMSVKYILPALVIVVAYAAISTRVLQRRKAKPSAMRRNMFNLRVSVREKQV